MKSIALWYKNIGGKATEHMVSLHFNLWKLPKSKAKFEKFLDIGILLEDAADIEEVKMYFPCKIENHVLDLGKIISEDKKLLSSIFNEDLSITTQPNSSYVEVSGNSIESFNIYTLGKCNISSEKFENDNEGGTILKLKNLNVENRKKVYIRIRINDKSISELFHEEELSNAFIQNAFSKSETIDFRLNEIREIDTKVLEEHINTNCFFKIQKAHFFYMCSSKEENLFSNKELNNCRYLEKERWSNYINSSDLNTKSIVLAYHWKFAPKKGDELTGFGLLIKSKFESLSWKHLTKYLLCLLVITVGLNFLSNFLYGLIQMPSQKTPIENTISKPVKSNTKK